MVCLKKYEQITRRVFMFQVLATFLTNYEFRKGVISGGVLFFYWLLLSFLGVVPFRSNIMRLQKAEQVSGVYWHGHRLTFGLSLGIIGFRKCNFAFTCSDTVWNELFDVWCIFIHINYSH